MNHIKLPALTATPTHRRCRGHKAAAGRAHGSGGLSLPAPRAVRAAGSQVGQTCLWCWDLRWVMLRWGMLC